MPIDLRNFLCGFAIGAANVIPGVSGGTLAVTLGIYERLINCLRSVNLTFLKLVLARRFAEAAAHADLRFLIGIGAGVLGSLLTLARVLKLAFEHYPVAVWAFFFGLVLASVFSVTRLVRRWSASRWLLFAGGCAVAVALAFLTPAGENTNPLYLMLCGVAAMCSMIIPGVSGSFVLLLMGNYKLVMLESVTALSELRLGEALPVLVPVGIGAVAGLLALSHFLGWLFRNYHDLATSVIGGFVLGSLAIIWPWKAPGEVERIEAAGKVKEKILSWDYQLPDPGAAMTWIAVALAVTGFLVVALTERREEGGERRA